MSTEAVLSIIQTLIIVLASGIALYQLRISAKSSRSEAYSRIGDRLQSLNELEFHNPEVFEKLSLTTKAVEKLSKKEGNEYLQSKLVTLCDIQFAYYREIYNHHRRYGLVNNSQWTAWKEIISRYLEKPFIEAYWSSNKWKYTKEFNDEIQKLIKPKG